MSLSIRSPFGLDSVLRAQSSLEATHIAPPPLDGALPFIDPNCFKVIQLAGIIICGHQSSLNIPALWQPLQAVLSCLLTMHFVHVCMAKPDCRMRWYVSQVLFACLSPKVVTQLLGHILANGEVERQLTRRFVVLVVSDMECFSLCRCLSPPSAFYISRFAKLCSVYAFSSPNATVSHALALLLQEAC